LRLTGNLFLDLNFNLNNKIVQRIEQTNKRYKEDFKKFKSKRIHPINPTDPAYSSREKFKNSK